MLLWDLVESCGENLESFVEKWSFWKFLGGKWGFAGEVLWEIVGVVWGNARECVCGSCVFMDCFGFLQSLAMTAEGKSRKNNKSVVCFDFAEYCAKLLFCSSLQGNPQNLRKNAELAKRFY